MSVRLVLLHFSLVGATIWGPSLEARDYMGRTALIRAAAVGDTNRVTLLLDTGAYVDAQDNDGRTALHHAVEGNPFPEGMTHSETEKLWTQLLKEKDENGCTPLIRAAKLGMAVTVKRLLTEYADPLVEDDKGRTALYHAVLLHDQAVASSILEDPMVKYDILMIDGASIEWYQTMKSMYPTPYGYMQMLGLATNYENTMCVLNAMSIVEQARCLSCA